MPYPALASPAISTQRSSNAATRPDTKTAHDPRNTCPRSPQLSGCQSQDREHVGHSPAYAGAAVESQLQQGVHATVTGGLPWHQQVWGTVSDTHVHTTT